MAVEDASSYGQTSSTTPGQIKTKHQLDLLDLAHGMMVLDKFATTKVMGKGEGGTLRLSRLLRIAKKTTTDTAGYLYNYSNCKAIESDYQEVTPSKFGDSFMVQEEVDWDSWLDDEDRKKEIANQVARSMEFQISKAIATQGMRHLIDKDTTYQIKGQPDSDCTTSTLNDDGITSSVTFDNGYITFYNPEGPGYDQTRQISTNDDNSFTFTTALKTAPSTSSFYRAVLATNIAATDILTTDALLDVAFLHRKLQTEKFPGGVLRGLLDADAERDLWDDTIWKDTAKYDDSGRYRNYRLVRWLDQILMIGSETYREDTDSTENYDDGAVQVTPIFGANSYSVVKWGMGLDKFALQWLAVNTADSHNLRNNASFLSWKARFVAHVMRATSVICLLHGYTDHGLDSLV